MKKKITFIPVSDAKVSFGSPVHVHILNRIARLNIPLKYLRMIANEFDTYVEVKLEKK